MLGVVAVVSACADTGDGPLLDDEAVASTTVATTSVAAPTVTEELPTIEAPATSVAPPTSLGPPPSEGTVDVGETRYDFAVTCHELGAGEVLVIGAGDDPVSGGLVELYLQAFLGDPYIGLKLADETLLEPSLDSPLDLYMQDDVIRASAIRFVRDLDLDTGAATEIGFGEFEIHCYEYSNELPE